MAAGLVAQRRGDVDRPVILREINSYWLRRDRENLGESVATPPFYPSIIGNSSFAVV